MWAAEWIKSDTSRIGLGPRKDPKTTGSVEMLPKVQVREGVTLKTVNV